VDSGLDECMISFEEDGMDGADCADSEQDNSREQVSRQVVLCSHELIRYAFLTFLSGRTCL
jgi:hypothetical protein